jgi:hypothetical protein
MPGVPHPTGKNPMETPKSRSNTRQMSGRRRMARIVRQATRQAVHSALGLAPPRRGKGGRRRSFKKRGLMRRLRRIERILAGQGAATGK